MDMELKLNISVTVTEEQYISLGYLAGEAEQSVDEFLATRLESGIDYADRCDYLYSTLCGIVDAVDYETSEHREVIGTSDNPSTDLRDTILNHNKKYSLLREDYDASVKSSDESEYLYTTLGDVANALDLPVSSHERIIGTSASPSTKLSEAITRRSTAFHELSDANRFDSAECEYLYATLADVANTLGLGESTHRRAIGNNRGQSTELRDVICSRNESFHELRETNQALVKNKDTVTSEWLENLEYRSRLLSRIVTATTLSGRCVGTNADPSDALVDWVVLTRKANLYQHEYLIAIAAALGYSREHATSAIGSVSEPCHDIIKSATNLGEIAGSTLVFAKTVKDNTSDADLAKYYRSLLYRVQEETTTGGESWDELLGTPEEPSDKLPLLVAKMRKAERLEWVTGEPSDKDDAAYYSGLLFAVARALCVDKAQFAELAGTPNSPSNALVDVALKATGALVRANRRIEAITGNNYRQYYRDLLKDITDAFGYNYTSGVEAVGNPTEPCQVLPDDIRKLMAVNAELEKSTICLENDSEYYRDTLVNVGKAFGYTSNQALSDIGSHDNPSHKFGDDLAEKESERLLLKAGVAERMRQVNNATSYERYYRGVLAGIAKALRATYSSIGSPPAPSTELVDVADKLYLHSLGLSGQVSDRNVKLTEVRGVVDRLTDLILKAADVVVLPGGLSTDNEGRYEGDQVTEALRHVLMHQWPNSKRVAYLVYLENILVQASYKIAAAYQPSLVISLGTPESPNSELLDTLDRLIERGQG